MDVPRIPVGGNKNYSSRNFDRPELVPEGSYFANVIAIIDIGGQKKTFKGEDKGFKPHIVIGYELTDHTYIDGQHKLKSIIYVKYSNSFYGNSVLKQHVEAVIGRELTKEDMDAEKPEDRFNLGELFNKAGYLHVKHHTYTKNGNDVSYEVVKTIDRLRPNDNVEKPQRKPLYFSVHQFPTFLELTNDPTFKRLNGKVQYWIKTSLEYQELEEIHKEEFGNDASANSTYSTSSSGNSSANNHASESNTAAAAASNEQMAEDDLPF